MAEADDPRLQVEVAGLTVGARLDQAIARGAVRRHEDGGLSLSGDAVAREEVGGKGGFLGQRAETDRFCHFLNDFLFDQAYGEATVPFGCQDCYKIKVSTRSLRAMMAVKGIAEATAYSTKSGSDVDNPTNSSLYSTYLYFDGIVPALETFRNLRRQLDEHPDLGPDVAATIKRGCSNYERKVGPSDRYAFDARLADVEAYLRERFVDCRPPRSTPKEAVKALRMLRLIEIAYRIGDETYKDFTGGKPIFAPTVDYAPPLDGPRTAPGETPSATARR